MFYEAAMTREPLLRAGDFAIWSLILGAVVGYQIWIRDTAPPLTTFIAVVDYAAG